MQTQYLAAAAAALCSPLTLFFHVPLIFFSSVLFVSTLRQVIFASSLRSSPHFKTCFSYFLSCFLFGILSTRSICKDIIDAKWEASKEEEDDNQEVHAQPVL